MALADVRDSIAVTLMGWCAKLATKQYQGELASYIQLGMNHTYAISEPSYGEELMERPHGAVHATWVSIN